MTRTFVKAAACLALALAAAGSAQAHHSFAMFDQTKEIVLKGTVKEFQWTNPHSWIQLVVLENGKPVEYSLEGQSPIALTRRGWSRGTLKPGDKVTVTMNPLRSGDKGGLFIKAVLPDGKIVA